jgi:carboxypeptidase Q
MNRFAALAIAIAAAATTAIAASAHAADEKPNLAIVHAIKAEAAEGKVMDHLFWLTDANGPRLTNSPGWKKAADWAVRTLKSWGAANPHLEKWGTFGRGWALDHFSINMVKPVYTPLHGAPKAWSGSTNGKVSAELVFAPLFKKNDNSARGSIPKLAEAIKKYIDAHKGGALRGKIVLISDERDFEPRKEPTIVRLDENKLKEVVTPPELEPRKPYEWPLMEIPSDPKERRAFMASLPTEVIWDFFARHERVTDALYDFFAKEGVVAVLTNVTRGEGGVVFAESEGDWQMKAPIPIPSIVLAPEQYNRLVRLTQKKVTTQLELDVGSRYTDDSPDGYNVIGEIPGHKKRDEVVMLGAHLDSWHTGTGATDNGAGSAVVLEAFRILRALNLPMDRTVRLALWSGEEQGLFGSRGYVLSHFGDPVTMKLRSEHGKLAAYFNLDNGSGKIRGIYLQGNDMVRPIFDAWLAPFKDEGATTISIRDTGGTDHQSFDAVGLPGFQFIQDPLDYESRTHHSELDVYDHANPSDLIQASAVLASFVYDAAMRPEMLPRKPLPKPLPPKRK